MGANKILDEFASILVSKKNDGLTLDTAIKDRFAILVSQTTSNTGSTCATSNFKLFSSGKKGAKIPDRLVLQVSRCSSVFDGLCTLLNTLQDNSRVVKNVTQLDITFVESVHNKSNASADDAKEIAAELTRLLPKVTSYRCAMGIESNHTMLAFASSIADRYAAQLSGLVCHWKILYNMRKFTEKLSNLERLVICGESRTDTLHKEPLVLPKLNHLAIETCPYTLSLLLNIEKSKSISKAVISISNALLFEMTDFTLDEAIKEKLVIYSTDDAKSFDMIMFSNALIAQDRVAKEVTAYINKELVHEDVDWIYWNNVTKLVVTTCIGFADILMLLTHSPNIGTIEAKKVIHVFKDEALELYKMLTDTDALDDKEVGEIATPAANYNGELPADLCIILACKKVDKKVMRGLRKWASCYNDWLESSDINDIYEMYTDKMELEDVEYHFAKAKEHTIHTDG